MASALTQKQACPAACTTSASCSSGTPVPTQAPGLWYCEPWTPSNFIADVKSQFYLVISVLTSETPNLSVPVCPWSRTPCVGSRWLHTASSLLLLDTPQPMTVPSSWLVLSFGVWAPTPLPGSHEDGAGLLQTRPPWAEECGHWALFHPCLLQLQPGKDPLRPSLFPNQHESLSFSTGLLFWVLIHSGRSWVWLPW